MKMQNFNVCAILINYRKADLTMRCIESLIGQVQFICVVDNSACDAEFNLMKKHIQSLQSVYEDVAIKLLYPAMNLGFGAGVQYGLDYIHSRRDLCFKAILLINNDAVAHNGMVNLMLQKLQMHHYKAVVAPRLKDEFPSSVFWYHRISGIMLKRPFPGAFPYLTGACIMLPAELTRKKETLFDPEFFMYGEDIEFAWYLHRAGIPMIQVPAAEFDHQGSASAPHGEFFYEYHVTRMHILLARKLAKNRMEAAILLLGRAFALPLRALRRAFRQKSLVPVYALMAAWAGKPGRRL